MAFQLNDPKGRITSLTAFLGQMNTADWCNGLTELFSQQSAALHRHDSLLLHITLITSQDDLCIVPGVSLYLG